MYIPLLKSFVLPNFQMTLFTIYGLDLEAFATVSNGRMIGATLWINFVKEMKKANTVLRTALTMPP